jgi:hypothetical protein
VLNKPINLWGFINGEIVGVVKDYNDRSFRRGIDPVLITTVKRGYSQAGIKLTTAGYFGAMRSIEKIWNENYPEFVFEYKFLDDKIESFYKQENQLSNLYKNFCHHCHLTQLSWFVWTGFIHGCAKNKGSRNQESTWRIL